MELYRTSDIVGHETNTLRLEQEGQERYRVAFGTRLGEAALFQEDRRILHVYRVHEFAAWKLLQDGVHRATITNPAPWGWWFVLYGTAELLSPEIRNQNRIELLPFSREFPPREHYGVHRSATDWDVSFYGRSRARIGGFQRLSNCCQMEVADGADRFQVLGLGLFVLAALKEEAVLARLPRMAQPGRVYIHHTHRERRPAPSPPPPERPREPPPNRPRRPPVIRPPEPPIGRPPRRPIEDPRRRPWRRDPRDDYPDRERQWLDDPVTPDPPDGDSSAEV